MYADEIFERLNLYSVSSFTSCAASRNSEQFKNQYSYKIMLYTHGQAYMEIKNIKQICRSGDAVFLMPGDKYRVLNNYGDFTVINIYFGFRSYNYDEQYTYQKYFDPSKCMARENIADAHVLNSSFIASCPAAADTASQLLAADSIENVPLAYIRKSLLCAIISMLVTSSADRNEMKIKITDCIDKHLSDGINVSAAADFLNIHPVHLNRLIKRYMGCSASEYITRKKLERAKIYLTETDMSITEIAYSLNFFDEAHFSNTFKSHIGTTPSSYRKRLNFIASSDKC